MSDALFTHHCFAGFDACLKTPDLRSVVVAVSGGSDSMALLLLTRDYLRQNLPDCRLIAVTVDHGLRLESAQEAAGVAELCKTLGVQHQTLRWEGVKPQHGVAAAARNARYALLVEAARKHDATVILTGHTADDQVETYIMRSQRLSGDLSIAGAKRGLAAMAAQTLLQDSILLARPLLKLWRKDLRAFLQAQNIGWYDDPSNVNRAYERPRIRQLTESMDKEAIFDAAQQAALQRRSDNHRIVQLLAREHAGFELLPTQRLFIRAESLNECGDLLPLMLSYLLVAIGGASLLPSLFACTDLALWLRNDVTSQPQRRTLTGCVIVKSAKGVQIWRENRNLPVMELKAGQSIVWDGRYHITSHLDLGLTIAALKPQQLSDYIQERGGADLSVHRESLRSSPAIFAKNRLIGLPLLDDKERTKARLQSGIEIKLCFACFDQVLSGHDFEIVPVVKRLLTMPFNHKYR